VHNRLARVEQPLGLQKARSTNALLKVRGEWRRGGGIAIPRPREGRRFPPTHKAAT